MRRITLILSGVSAAAIAAATAAQAQMSLPSIDIGKPKQVTRTAAKAKPAPHTGASRSAGPSRGNAAPVAGPATSGEGQVSAAAAAAAAAQNYGGAGPQQSPFNTSYTYEKATTALKTSTPLMETPVNVQSVTQQVLRDNQVTDLSRALQFVSGVTTTNGPTANGNPYGNIVIRGFSTNYIYRDGFRLDMGNGPGAAFGFGASQLVQFANVQSIEVLKGAAAVMYGLSEPGGLVNVITKQPLDQPFYAVDVQGSSLADYRTTVDATGPLTSDKSWLYRMNMSYENNGAPFGSFIDNTHSENIFVAPVVKWNIDNDNWVKLEGQYYRNNFSGYFPSNPQINGSFVSLPRNTNYQEWSPANNNNIFSALTLSHNFDKDWSFKQIFYYARYEIDDTQRLGTGLFDFSFPYFTFASPDTSPVYGRGFGYAHYGTQTMATEADISGKIETWGLEHTLLFGGDFYKTLNWNNYFFGQMISPESIFYPVHPGIPLLETVSPSESFTNPQDTAGLYAQDQIKLPYDLFFLASARYQYFRQGGGATGVPSFATNWGGTLTAPQQASAEQHLTPRFGLLWRPFPWVSGYISYAEGFSTNTGVTYPGNVAPPSGARDAEAGLKFEFFDGKLRATVDYYNLTKTNVPEPDPNPLHFCGGLGFFNPGGCVILIGEARSKGPEVDIQGELYPGLNVILAYTNQSVEVTKTSANDLTNTRGQPLPGIPRNVATLSGTYEFQDGALKGLKLGATYHYNGAQRVNDFTYLTPGPGSLLPSLAGYGTVDLLADYPFYYEGWKLDAGVNVHNLFDRTYYTGAYLTAPLVGLAGSYGGRSIGDNFSVMGHISAQWPGLPPIPPRSSAPAMSWVHDWTGPYAGAQIGMNVGDNAGTFSYVTPDGYFGTPSFVTNGYGVLAGVHLGYNQQFDNWVLGLEASGDVTNLNKREQLGWSSLDPNVYLFFPPGAYCNAGACGGAIDARIQSNFQGSLRARAGYAWNRLLAYGTGGLAFGNFDLQSSLGEQIGIDPTTGVPGAIYSAAANDRSVWRLGWTAGAGVEYAITPRWSARAEYRYSDFGHIAEAPNSFSSAGVWYQGDRHVTQNQLQVGASYKFGGTDPEMFAIAAPIFKGPALGDLPSHKGGPILPTAYAANWTGFYLGGQAGYGWGDNHGAYNFGTPDGVVASGALKRDAQGVIFGAHAGYNQQLESDLVLGVEASLDGTTLIKRESLAASDLSGNQAALTSMVQSDIQGSLRGRAGYAFGRLLPYVTGGLAIGHFGTQSDFAAGSGPNFAYDGYATHGLQWTTRLGWTVGGGAEWAVSDHWSIRGEYRYSEFGTVSDTPTVALPGTLYGGGRRLDQNQFQIGASYKFGDPLLVPVAAPVLAAKAPPIDWTGYNWAGLYVGGQVGMIWGANHGDYYVATPGGLAAYDPLTSDAQVASVEGHVGYNWQLDHVVAGLEGSLLGTNLVKSSLLPVYDFSSLTPGGTLTTAVKSNLQGSLRTRLGYAWDRLLPFVTGGFALGGFTQQSYVWGGDAQGLFNASSSRSSLRAGWTLGAGAEWAMTRSWAVRGEYRYTDFGTVSDASTYAAPLGTLFTGTRRLDQNLLEFGVSYKFGEDGQAPLVVAADLPHLKDAPVVVPPQGSPWRGFYAGVNAGGVFDAANGQGPTSIYWDPSLSFGSGVNPNVAYMPAGRNSGSGGALGGGQVGYNYQMGPVLIGAEADIAVTSVPGGGKQTAALYASPFSGGALAPAAPLNTAQASLPYVGTLRGRAGYLVTPTLLLHTTAGFAYDGVDAWGVANTRAGWTVGAGAEWMFAQNWSAKLEYLFADISGGGISGGWSGNYDANFHPQLNILRGGLNYHFNSFAPEAIVAKY